ncbi:DeoR/GlpR family DNA-binding transcription regulator [Comamonas endophytica]|uniref:DeoR/GlpR family DNA-binding transcription regulator n=1 Tax=Comamonas endophytica TaxID=2949090 RepID=A0ABY6GEG1_9BURK|nr:MULTISPECIES: DeoR/GlpR family DNA-binding transcription regulator [unclassified Acidovorax]MCD2513278.1 DeoR/GlpR family DNA-binding transcription regulator [Acidovorax sp. D4N7]UYG53379.1 DeoR/GlpR family DNA-binding transcription regulator [Acidovorax sp. 5MLIR]
MSETVEHSSVRAAGMIPAQRRETIVRQLHKHQVLSMHQLTELLGCSHMTVRRDVAALEEQGRVYAVPGGVRIASHQTVEPTHQAKSVTELPQKRGIAAQAARLLKPGMTVYLDAGTTVACLIPRIVELADMTVITNDFHVALMLAEAPQVTVVHTGGVLDHRNGSSIGPLAAATLRQLVADISFLSASAWDLERGVTTPSAPKVEVKRAAMAIGSQRVLLATNAKYGTYGTYRVAALGEFDLIVTDDTLSEAAAQRMREAGLDLEIARALPDAAAEPH